MMDIIGDCSKYDSSLPWLWIAEYLSTFKEVDTSVLKELVEMVPTEYSDDLTKRTNEAVALRCLEDLCGIASADDNVPSVQNKIEIDLSRSCEDVLQQILQQTPEADLAVAGPELLKWDVQRFIRHKKALMPKCALQKLKDTILDGSIPSAAFLKEKSGLMRADDFARSNLDDARHNAAADANAQPVAGNGNLKPPVSKNGNKLPSKRNRVDLISDHLTNSKKLKHDIIGASHPFEHVSVPPHNDKVSKDDSARVTAGDTGGKGCENCHESQDEHMVDSHYPDDGHNEHADSGRNWQNDNVNDGEAQHREKVVGYVADQNPQVIHTDKPVAKVIVDETNVTELRISTGAPLAENSEKDSVRKSQGGIEHLCEDVSCDNDGHNEEDFEVDLQKSHFLHSQLGDDALTTNGCTEQNLCVKCNKDGQLLFCSSSSCPLVIHEHCLGSPANFDENGKFYCPFCSYSRSISAYLEAKKKAILARKELTAFIQMGLQHHPRVSAERCSKDCSHSLQNGHGEIENEQLEHQEKNKSDHISLGSKKQLGPSAPHPNVGLPSRDREVNVINETICISGGDKAGEEGPSASCPNIDLHSRDREVNVINENICISGGEKAREECLSVRGSEGLQDQTPAKRQCDSDEVPCVSSEVTPVHEIETEDGIQEEDSRQTSCGIPEKAVITMNTGGKATTECENDKGIISNYQIRYRRQVGQYSCPTMPQLGPLRRKKLPWTQEEEEILKRGVKKFSKRNDTKIPWKQILEFGGSRFARGRTAIDLKDKWRNMNKGSPKTR